MPSHVNRKLRKADVDPACLKNLCLAFNIKKAQVDVVRKETRVVALSDIVDMSMGGWADGAYAMYANALTEYERLGKRGSYDDTELWRKELADAPGSNIRVVRNRIMKFFALYDSIKANGFKKRSNNLVKLLTLDGRTPCGEIRGMRLSKKYFRLTGFKRCIICLYLGIKEIPCRIFVTRIHQL